MRSSPPDLNEESRGTRASRLRAGGPQSVPEIRTYEDQLIARSTVTRGDETCQTGPPSLLRLPCESDDSGDKWHCRA